VIYYQLLYHLPYAQKKDSKLEKTVIEQCDRILTVGEKYKEKLLSKSKNLSSDKFHICRIGYDENLFPDAEEIPQKKFCITYTGTMADYYQPQIFFHALKSIAEQNPDIPFELRFVGIIAETIQENIVQAGLREILEVTGYISHEKAVSYLKSSTALLLVNPAIKNEEVIIPGKIYEYLAAWKPIINITRPESETAYLIEQCKAGKTFSRDKQDELEEYLNALVKAWMIKKTLDLPYNEQVKQFSRKHIATELEGFLLH
jgi:glycosyltransferase involved in cell wall biosynthesis